MAAFAFRIPITSRIHRRRRMRRLSGDDGLRTARNVDGRATAGAITIRLHSRRLRNKMPDLTRNGAILLLGSTFHKLAQVRR
ncbi:MAG: hypothetical protein WCF49_10160 [Xanthobacteraceae bacterium]